MAKKSKDTGGKKAAKQRFVTMQALNEMSDDDDGMPPESEWNEEAKALKEAIEKGKFDKLINSNKEEGSSFEEVDLDDESSSENDTRETAVASHKGIDKQMSNNEDSQDEGGKSENSNSTASSDDVQDAEHQQSRNSDSSSDDDEEQEDADQQQDSEEIEKEDVKETPMIAEKNNVKTKALQVVTESLVAERRGWPWAETFDIIVETPLPFGGDDAAAFNIHDDLKREVAFYDTALEAVVAAKVKCQEADIPFQRPDDFFAEMVKTDEHMAKIKDRLIFENKKMEAVAQRKANKEQKLRAKESQANKLAEKAKRKKDHFRAVEDWAQTAASNRGRRLNDNDDGGEAFFNNKSKKRQYADRKYGFGGKRGRFKQNDPKALDDMSGFDRRGNFGGMGTKKSAKPKTGGAGSNRRGKRARDASRRLR